MKNQRFKAMVVEEGENRTFTRQIREKAVEDLPGGDVLVRVQYSSLNYKDALSATGNRGVTRNYPHTPGIDAAGTVAESGDSRFQAGDAVIVTSYDLGMNTPGGFGQYIRVPGDWVVRLPKHLTLRESMIYGTAGFTAGMSVCALAHGVQPDQGDVLVTGATGGVGSIAVALLSRLGYAVSAATGKTAEKQFLMNLGAKAVIGRDETLDTGGRPMLRARWAGVIDTVGGDMLATAIKSAKPNGIVTCCGNVASPDLPITVFPFILRGVTLVGIDSQNCPMEHRMRVWEKLAGEWKPDRLAELCREISLNELDENIDLILRGGQKGRVVVNLDA
ncbi:quinone oxidoreductase [Desulfonema ishimotonii]|uniref:Quinone oxidoreductase n=1 Tax=Desulfonema ishimotonii TaxID=45657 RepID=A0A401G3E6_9BACT|nr:YhdH/YhfP family quinone oxidoreductase [Desulfonema ishimotonii]GBC63701.1 quinone oxidoreductase [Desulfonema ishimotonii]